MTGLVGSEPPGCRSHTLLDHSRQGPLLRLLFCSRAVSQSSQETQTRNPPLPSPSTSTLPQTLLSILSFPCSPVTSVHSSSPRSPTPDIPLNLLGTRALQPRGSPLTPRDVTWFRARFSLAERVLSFVCVHVNAYYCV